MTAFEYLQTVKRNALKKALEVTTETFVLVLIYVVFVSILPISEERSALK